jgi:hypothetical protein
MFDLFIDCTIIVAKAPGGKIIIPLILYCDYGLHSRATALAAQTN